MLDGVGIDYRLHRAKRRSIGMQIGLQGLTVRAPRWIALSEIEDALVDRAAWVLKALQQWRDRRRDVLPREWITGAPILYRGSELALAVFPSRVRAIAADLFHLMVRHPAPHEERLVASFVGHWLREETVRLLAPQVARLAARVARPAPSLKLTNARSEWGSCNHKGEIRLNWRLVHLPAPLAEYVVAHEVAHLVELNHSARFWAVVAVLFPDYSQARRELGNWTALLEA